MIESRVIAALFIALPYLSGTNANGAPTFYKDVAPIIYGHCSPCHRPGQSAPFSLLSYEDVKHHARQIADVTGRRYMPPWLPESAYGEFDGDLRLTDDQIKLIRTWVQSGTPTGSPGDGPAPPQFTPDWQLGRPDLIVHAAKPYLLDAAGPDQFWNFVLPLPLKETRWVKAVEIRPGNTRVFHHANLLIDRSGSGRRMEKTPGAGFAGMDVPIEEDNFDPDGHFLFWKPGSFPMVEPDGMAWRAVPGMDLVLNVHLQPSGKRELVQPSIGIYFTSHPQTKFPMLLQLEHDGALDIPAGDSDFVVTDELKLPIDVNVLAIYPHAHYLGKLLEGYATLPDGSKRWLIRIPNWDLNWQAIYRYANPIALPKGTILSMRFHYDNSTANPRNPNNPPKRVRSGNNSTDEMGHLWIQVLPAGEHDSRPLLQETIMRRRLEKYPADFSSHMNLGSLLMMRGDSDGAIRYFQDALRVRPDNSTARNALGAALLSQSRVAEATDQFRLVLAADPGYTDAHYNLGNALASEQKWQPAATEFRAVLKERPDDNAAREHLLEVLLRWGDDLIAKNNLEQAVSCYREAVVLKPDEATLHANLGTALARLGHFSEAIPQFETALSLDPNLEVVKRNLAAARAMMQATR